MINHGEELLSAASHDAAATGRISPRSVDSHWAYDCVFGIVHHEGCRSCQNHMMHISDFALDDFDSESYTQALHQRDAELRRRFMEGFRRGRSTQQEHDNERLKTYRAQRDEARVLEAAQRYKVEDADALILSLRDELLALQIAYEEVRSHTPYNSGSCGMLDGAKTAGGVFTSSVSDFDSEESASSDSFDEPQTPELLDDDEGADSSSDDDGGYESTMTSDGEEIYTEIEFAEERADGGAHLTNADCEPSIQLNNLSFAAIEDDFDETYDDSDFDDADTDDGSDDDGRTPTSPQPTSTNQLSLSLQQTDPLSNIRKQMQLAHRPDERGVLEQIKTLVSQAHRTPASLRSEVQKILLVEWRNPRPLPRLTLNNSLGPAGTWTSNPVAVYVDASGIGIGFVFANQWQAWRLKDGWKQGKCREIQWAEAVAVELGLRLMIGAGYSGRTITLHSDNLQVVDAIQEKRPIAEPYTTQIIRKIHSLCRQYHISLDISWIPGSGNPADAPSRLKSIEGTRTRFPCYDNIPEHLEEFVLPYHP